MLQNFLFPQRDQPLLLPVNMREWPPEDDLAFAVLDAVATLDNDGYMTLALRVRIWSSPGIQLVAAVRSSGHQDLTRAGPPVRGTCEGRTSHLRAI
jgi:hypothetical protein